jgi:pyruvate/oxaloacetate carboxyltransferase
LGTPPLVTPTSQIVGVQAVLNVLFGKYKMVTNEVKDLVFGLYGKTPTQVDPEVRKKVLKGYKRGETPVTGRAADYLEPELEEARKKIGDLAKDDFDLIIFALYPTTGEKFLKWKYGLEEKPPEVMPKTLDDIRREDEAMAAAIEQVCKTA